MNDSTHVERLAPLDLPMPRTYIRVLLVFGPTGSRLQITQSLQGGLDRLSKQVRWLSGQVFPRPATPEKPSSLEIRWDANNTPTLIVKGTIANTYRWASSHRMPIEAIPSDVWPVPSMIDDALFATGAPVFAASVFGFADQGVGLCVCLHHNAVDGTGLSEIIRLWSRNVADPRFTFSSSSQNRSERLSEALSFDLQATSAMSSEDLFSLHPEYSKTPPALPENFPSCRCKLFAISIHWIDILKELMRRYTSTALTTNTVICALIWTTVTRVRMQSNPSLENETTQLATAVNGRQRIGESFSTLRSPFFGNAVFYALSKLPAGTLAASDEAPVRSLAMICDQITRSQSHIEINSRHIAEVYRLIDLVEDCTKSLFVGWDLFRSRDFTITSWADLGLYEMDFGDGIGRPKFVRLPSMEADGVALILPRQRGVPQEMLEIMVMLRSDHMDALERDPMWQTLLSVGVDDEDGKRLNM